MPGSFKNTTQLTIMVALACEAKPIIDRLRLKKKSNTSFPLYLGQLATGSEAKVNLVVSGIGALNMAAAVGWLGAQLPVRNSLWLNIGIAGHHSFDIGTCARVISCFDLLSERSFYPPLVSKWEGQSMELISCNVPTDDYADNRGVDMEAAAFFAVAGKFSSMELIQCIKVVSDNPDSPADRLNAKLISELIQPAVGACLSFAEGLAELQPSTTAPLRLPTWVAEMHCTESQRVQLIELCRKLQSMGFDDERIAGQVEGLSSIKAILAKLSTLQLETAPDINSMIRS